MKKSLLLIALLAILPLTAYQSVLASCQEQKVTRPSDVLSHTIVRRASFDIGSGKIKVQISDVDLTANKIMKKAWMEH